MYRIIWAICEFFLITICVISSFLLVLFTDFLNNRLKTCQHDQPQRQPHNEDQQRHHFDHATQPVLVTPPTIPAGMTGIRRNPLESTGMRPESAGMQINSTGMQPESAGIGINYLI